MFFLPSNATIPEPGNGTSQKTNPLGAVKQVRKVEVVVEVVVVEVVVEVVMVVVVLVLSSSSLSLLSLLFLSARGQECRLSTRPQMVDGA